MSPFKNVRFGARFILTLTRATIVCLCILIWSQILEAQGLQFDPWQLDFGDVPAGSPSPLTKTATLRNSGNNTVNWNARLSPYVTGFPIWLSVSPTSGTLGAGQSATLTFSVKPDSMTPNSLRSQIDIVGDVSSTGMPVYIRFVRSAVLTFTPPSVNHALPTSGPSSQYLFNDTITVKNKGFGTPGGLVDVSSVITNTWGNGPGHSWSISVKSATVVAGKIPSDKSGAYMLEVDARGITTPGTYRGSVVFYAPNATNWYDSVVVTLNPSGATLTITDITPDGVAYDPNYLDPTTGTHTFTDLMIDGKGLDQVTGVTFERPNDIEVTRVAAKTNQVDFDIKVSQGAALGERDVLLTLSGNNKVNVSSSLGKKFIITRITMQFNQAVDQNALKDLTYRDKLVANKLGVVRIQFDDPNQHGRAFGAALTIEGISARTTSPESHTYQASYSEADIIAGRDYLTVPLPQPLEKGIRKVKTAMATADRLIYCPTITREIIESLPLRILGVSYRVHKPNAPPGTPPLEPPSDASARNATDLLKLVYPVSGNKVTYIHIGTRDLPSKYETKEVTYVDGSKKTILTGKGIDDLFSSLRDALKRRNKKEGPNSQFDFVIAFLPEYILLMDRNNDGKIEFPTDFFALGLNGQEAILVAKTGPFGLIFAHEIGHHIVSRTSEATLDVSILEEQDLGDEYEGGAIHCNVNPPVQGVKGWKGETSCPNSTLVPGKDGDASGIYTDWTAFNPATMTPMLTWIGEAQTVKTIISWEVVLG